MKLTRDIQKKILEATHNFNVDSDLHTFSEETGISYDDILRVILNNEDVFEPCHGCLYIINRVYPLVGTTCEHYSRANKLEDCYVPDLRFNEED